MMKQNSKNYFGGNRASNIDDFSFIKTKNLYSDAGLQLQKKRNFLFSHTAIMLILCSLAIGFIIFLILANGRPITFINNAVVNFLQKNDHNNPLLDEDTRQIALYTDNIKDNTGYTCKQLDDELKSGLMRNFFNLNAANGNSFIEVENDHFYLSGDRQRLYLCVFPLQLEKNKLVQETSAKRNMKDKRNETKMANYSEYNDMKLLHLTVKSITANKGVVACQKCKDHIKTKFMHGYSSFYSAPGNSFFQFENNYFYLSDDRQRLYLCLSPMQSRYKTYNDRNHDLTARVRNIERKLSPPQEPQYTEQESVYIDKEGFYKNRKKYTFIQ